MFDLFIIALLQFATLSDNPTTANKIGAAGWENDFAPTTKTTANKIGAAGWENDFAPTTNSIGAAGWEND